MSLIRKFNYDPNTDLTTISSSQDITAIVNNNKDQYNSGIAYGSDMRKVASIPLVVFEELIKMGFVDMNLQVLDEKALLRWLENPDNKIFKTSPERLI